MMFLKQSTAVDIPMGPFVDSVDGVTPETGLTITQPDIRLKKNGSNWAQKNAAQTLSHEENGWYEVSLDATDTGTLGHLVVAIFESGALPVWREFQVVPENIYDSLIGGTDILDTNLSLWRSSFPNFLVSGRVDVTVGAMQADTVTAAAIAADAIGSSELAASAVTEIQSGLATSAEVAGVQADTNDIQTRLPAALVGGRMDSSVGALAADTITASSLAADAATEIADALLKRDMSAVSGEAARSLLNAIRKLMNRWAVSGGVLTIYKEDDTTPAWTQTVTSTAGAAPITELETD